MGLVRGKGEKMKELPGFWEGRGYRARKRRGVSKGLQDKPTFLKTPGVVITRGHAVKPNVADMASLSSIWRTKKRRRQNSPSG